MLNQGFNNKEKMKFQDHPEKEQSDLNYKL